MKFKSSSSMKNPLAWQIAQEAYDDAVRTVYPAGFQGSSSKMRDWVAARSDAARRAAAKGRGLPSGYQPQRWYDDASAVSLREDYRNKFAEALRASRMRGLSLNELERAAYTFVEPGREVDPAALVSALRKAAAKVPVKKAGSKKPEAVTRVVELISVTNSDDRRMVSTPMYHVEGGVKYPLSTPQAEAGYRIGRVLLLDEDDNIVSSKGGDAPKKKAKKKTAKKAAKKAAKKNPEIDIDEMSEDEFDELLGEMNPDYEEEEDFLSFSDWSEENPKKGSKKTAKKSSKKASKKTAKKSSKKASKKSSTTAKAKTGAKKGAAKGKSKAKKSASSASGMTLQKAAKSLGIRVSTLRKALRTTKAFDAALTPEEITKVKSMKSKKAAGKAVIGGSKKGAAKGKSKAKKSSKKTSKKASKKSSTTAKAKTGARKGAAKATAGAKVGAKKSSKKASKKSSTTAKAKTGAKKGKAKGKSKKSSKKSSLGKKLAG